LWNSILIYALLACVVATLSIYEGFVWLREGTSTVTSGSMLFGIALAYWAIVIVGLTWIHRLLRMHVMPRQGRQMPPLDLARLASATTAAPLALYLYGAAAWKARFARFVEWRSIRYDVVGAHAVRLAAYQPLADVATKPEKQLAAIPAARPA
jgi:hypothetical protein